MKKLILALLTGIILLNFNSCKGEDLSYSYNIKDALRISTWLFDESMEDNVYYGDDDAVYVFERLKLNEAQLMMPIASADMTNFNIFFEFDGIVEVISEDRDTQLSLGNPLKPWHRGEDPHARTHGFNVRLPYEGFIAIIPLGSRHGTVVEDGGVQRLQFYIDREYYLTVNAYKFDNEETPIIRAQLKLVQLENIDFPMEDSSPYFSIELISYEYSDIYRLLDEIWDDEDY